MNTILLSNLIKIRWIAIIGQFFAILIVYFLFKINILIFESLVVVIFSVVVNLFSYFLQKQDNKISDRLAFLFLLYDTCQLGILLYLTGGIFNPFCILIIAPVIISASYLPVFWTVILSLFSIILVLFINFTYIPIDWKGTFLTPNIYKQGLVFALIITIIFIAVILICLLVHLEKYQQHYQKQNYNFLIKKKLQRLDH